MATFRASIEGQQKSRSQAVTRLGQTNAAASLKGWEYGISLNAIKQESGRLLYHAYTNGGSSGYSDDRDISLEISTDEEGKNRVITLYYKGKLVDLDKASELATVS